MPSRREPSPIRTYRQGGCSGEPRGLEQLPTSRSRHFSEALETLARARAAGLRTAILSNGTPAVSPRVADGGPISGARGRLAMAAVVTPTAPRSAGSHRPLTDAKEPALPRPTAGFPRAAKIHPSAKEGGF
jgi:hypothetical protein